MTRTSNSASAHRHNRATAARRRFLKKEFTREILDVLEHGGSSSEALESMCFTLLTGVAALLIAVTDRPTAIRRLIEVAKDVRAGVLPGFGQPPPSRLANPQSERAEPLDIS